MRQCPGVARGGFIDATVFNALTSSQLLTGIGSTLRMAADARGALEGFERSQVLSAYSVTRLLASEQAAAEELLGWTRDALLAALAGDDRAPCARAREAIAAAPDGQAIGAALSELLPELPEDGTRRDVRRILREMIDREIAALASPATR
jgi:hypothetical protein